MQIDQLYKLKISNRKSYKLNLKSNIHEIKVDEKSFIVEIQNFNLNGNLIEIDQIEFYNRGSYIKGG